LAEVENTAAAIRRLLRVSAATPVVVLIVYAAGRRLLLPARGAGELLVLATLLLGGSAVVYQQAASSTRRLRDRLGQQSAELMALHDAGVAVSSDLALDTVLQTIVERARALLGTRYGALSVVDEDDRITAFLTAGGDPDLHRRVGSPPSGRGLLGLVLREGESLRLADITNDPRAAGFPAGHPQMRTLLAVPLPCRLGRRGNLYLSEREDGACFSAADEETLKRFARQAAIAVDNAVLHGEVRELAASRERLRLAGGMYDAMAQVLAYVNAKSQAVREHCRRGRIEAACEHLDQLAAAARATFAEQRARLLDLRALEAGGSSTVDALAHHVRAWEEESGVDVDLALPGAIEAAPDVELQLLRIVQEGLENVRRHAHASHARVSVTRNDGGLHLEIGDDGVGFDPALPIPPQRGPRFGLAAMRERAQAVGGKLEVVSGPGAGTILRLDLPTLLAEDAT
jgi:signal transduction histidine kinase